MIVLINVDLPKLEIIYADDCALSGDSDSSRGITINNYYSYKNTLTMKSMNSFNDSRLDLDSLTTIQGQSYCCFSYNAYQITIESMFFKNML